MRSTVAALFIIALFTKLPLKAGVAPTIKVNGSTTRLVNLDNSYCSGVIDDPLDPLSVYGIDFILTDEDVNSVTITSSSNTASVVPNDALHISVSGTGNIRNVKIKPAGIGYAVITVKVKDNENKTASFQFKYAASAAAIIPTENNFHTLRSSASTAIVYNTNFMFIGDDEINEIGLYHRSFSGAPLTISDITSHLNLPEPDKPEVDIEASCISPTNFNRLYWIGSMSNSNNGTPKPNRDRIFATDIFGTGATAVLSVAGYASLKNNLLEWGDDHGYQLSESAASGKNPKTIDGLSIEGMEFAPDDKTLYLGFRSPYVPVSNRTQALICPIVNFEQWFNNGSPSGDPIFGAPIELDLGGRGIRSIGKNENNEYLIIAGAFDEADNFAIYRWTGNPGDNPVLQVTALTGLSPEGIAEVPFALNERTPVEIVNDYGTMDWYGDGKESKSLSVIEFQKFSSTLINLKELATATENEEEDLNHGSIAVYPQPVSEQISISLFTQSDSKGTMIVYNVLGEVVLSQELQLYSGNNRMEVNCAGIPSGSYFISIPNTGFHHIRFIKQ